MAASPRVLSVQSHVVHGYVGNRAAVFPLQLLGFEVDVVNSVQFSCHTGYPAFPGQKLDGSDLNALVEGLAVNGVLEHTHLLTGYIGTASFLREVVQLRQRLPHTCCYVCDPVMGDNGKLYVPNELVDVYRKEVLPYSTILTPNQFETELLTNKSVTSLADAAEACDTLHGMGPSRVIITSMDVADATLDGKVVAMLLSQAGHRKWLLRLPFVMGGPFTGTGDLTAAMLLAWNYVHPFDPVEAMEKTGAVLQAVLRRTMASSMSQRIGDKLVPPELQLIQSKSEIERPPVSAWAIPLQPLPAVHGVIWGLEGVLTLPGQVDMTRIRELTGVATGDVVTTLRHRHAGNPSALVAAMAVVEEEELQGFKAVQLRPGLRGTIHALFATGCRLGLMTTASSACVELLLTQAQLPCLVFEPVCTRNTTNSIPAAPHPGRVLHCCKVWGLQPSAVLVIGAHIDDILAGRSAGCMTAAMLPPVALPTEAKSEGPSTGHTAATPKSAGSSAVYKGSLPDKAEFEARKAREATARRGDRGRVLMDTADFTISSFEGLQRLLRN